MNDICIACRSQFTPAPRELAAALYARSYRNAGAEVDEHGRVDLHQVASFDALASPTVDGLWGVLIRWRDGVSLPARHAALEQVRLAVADFRGSITAERQL